MVTTPHAGQFAIVQVPTGEWRCKLRHGRELGAFLRLDGLIDVYHETMPGCADFRHPQYFEDGIQKGVMIREISDATLLAISIDAAPSTQNGVPPLLHIGATPNGNSQEFA